MFLVSDNASNMRDIYLFLGLAIEDARFVVNFVKYRGHLLAKFRELQHAFKTKKGLSLPGPTRWYTQINCIANLLQNKVVFKKLIDTDELAAIVENQKQDQIYYSDKR